MYRNIDFEAQTLTDTATIYLNPAHNINEYEGSVLFTVTGTNATGTFDVDCQLQGANDSAFTKGVVNLGSPVALADTVTSAVPLSGNNLQYAYYRVAITGADTQSTAIIGTYTAKGKEVV